MYSADLSCQSHLFNSRRETPSHLSQVLVESTIGRVIPYIPQGTDRFETSASFDDWRTGDEIKSAKQLRQMVEGRTR